MTSASANRLDVADLAVQFEQDVALGIGRTDRAEPCMRRAVGHRLLGVEDRGQDLVVDVDLAAALLGRATESATTRRPLTHEPHHVVEDVGVVGVDEVVGVDRGGDRSRHVFPV